ncbi:MAG TPA: AraC family transcriptional regulator, partial [Saprospiraceae bacterium]|nr:AraC family transcriptional regulator [Saprospiraceae bacterium]
SHQDEAIKVAQQFIESNLQEKLFIEQIADQVAVGRRSFERRFKSATGNTVLEYIQRVKIEAAKRNFESTSMNISEVMYKVGYNDEKSFRSTFKKVTGVTPIAYKKKYQKNTTAV